MTQLATPSSAAASRAPRRSRLWWATGGSVGLSLAMSIYFIAKSEVIQEHRRAFVLFDDASISLVYARNLATGHGLAWTYGAHPVEGYTNFLWTLWMSALELTHVSDRMIGLLVMASGALLLALNTYLIAKITARITNGSVGAVAVVGALTATFFGLTLWTLQGMETGLVAALYSLAVVIILHIRATPDAENVTRWWFALGIVFAAAGLTRDDCLVIVAVLAIYAWRTLRPTARHLVAVAAPALVAILGHELWRLAYYGYPFPNTYYLKLDNIAISTRFYRGYLVLAQNLTLQYVIPVALVLVYVLARRRLGTKMPVGLPLLLGVVVVQAIYVFYVGGDSYDYTYWDRYLVPVIPLLFIVAVVATFQMLERAEFAAWTFGAVSLLVALGVVINWSDALPTWSLHIGPGFYSLTHVWIIVDAVSALGLVILGLVTSKGGLPAGRGVLVVALAVVVSVNVVPWARFQRSGPEALPLDRVTALIGVAMRYATPANATLAVAAVGNQTYFSHRAMIDLLGYTDHHVATTQPHPQPYFLPGHNKWDYNYSIKTLRPDVVIGLFEPTPTDIANMTTWGYRSQVFPFAGTIYWRPGWFSPAAFSHHLGTLVPPRHERVKVGG